MLCFRHIRGVSWDIDEIHNLKVLGILPFDEQPDEDDLEPQEVESITTPFSFPPVRSLQTNTASAVHFALLIPKGPNKLLIFFFT